jgi:hypothetical protein
VERCVELRRYPTGGATGILEAVDLTHRWFLATTNRAWTPKADIP